MRNGEAIPLTSVYKGWEVYQQKLVRAVAPLTAEQLELRAAPELRLIGMLIAHIIATRADWFHIVMGEGGSELVQISHWDEDGADPRRVEQLAQGLEDMADSVGVFGALDDGGARVRVYPGAWGQDVYAYASVGNLACD